jgi:hypothetical protein
VSPCPFEVKDFKPLIPTKKDKNKRKKIMMKYGPEQEKTKKEN